MDLFPAGRALLKADSYFINERAGFLDSEGRFKVFKEGEAPSLDLPFVTIEIQPGPQHQVSAWTNPFVTFHVTGLDTDWKLLWEIADEIRRIIQENTILPAVGEQSATHYQAIGSALFDEGRNPVTETVLVSVSQRIGLDY